MERNGLETVTLYVIKMSRVYFSPQGTDAKYIAVNNNNPTSWISELFFLC